MCSCTPQAVFGHVLVSNNKAGLDRQPQGLDVLKFVPRQNTNLCAIPRLACQVVHGVATTNPGLVSLRMVLQPSLVKGC